MRLRRAAAAWAMAATAMAVVAVPAHAGDRDPLPGFTASLDTTYLRVREVTADLAGERLDPRSPWGMAVYGGEADRYPLRDEELQTLADGGDVEGVERVALKEPPGDEDTFGQTQDEVARKMGKMIRGWLFTVKGENGDTYVVFCYTDGKQVLCKFLAPLW